MRRIISAAVKRADGLICSLPAPYRHSDVIVSGIAGEQGFLTSEGHFVGRSEAYVLALRSGQLREAKSGNFPELFTEDLW